MRIEVNLRMTTTKEKVSKGEIKIFEAEGEFRACRQTVFNDRLSAEEPEYEVLGEGATISDALREAAESIPEDTEGVSWPYEW